MKGVIRKPTGFNVFMRRLPYSAAGIVFGLGSQCRSHDPCPPCQKLVVAERPRSPAAAEEREGAVRWNVKLGDTFASVKKRLRLKKLLGLNAQALVKGPKESHYGTNRPDPAPVAAGSVGYKGHVLCSQTIQRELTLEPCFQGLALLEIVVPLRFVVD
jgi:hypothetical protein